MDLLALLDKTLLLLLVLFEILTANLEFLHQVAKLLLNMKKKDEKTAVSRWVETFADHVSLAKGVGKSLSE